MTRPTSLIEVSRHRRNAWRIGGTLMILSAMVGLAPAYGALALTGWAGVLLFSAALVLFAWGIRGSGSITARRPLGTTAIIALALWQLVAQVLATALPGWVMVSAIGPYLATAVPIVELVLATIAVTQIARIGVVSKPWRWAPMWGLAVVVLVRLVTVLLFTGIEDQYTLTGISGLTTLLTALVVAGLGVLAIVLAAQPTGERTVEVFPARQ